MRERLRSHLTYANVMATIAVFLVLSGGTAVALNGSNTVQSDDLGPGAQVKAADVADNAVVSADVANESLTGADIKNRSGVLTCQTPLTARYGPICVGTDGGARNFDDAINYCTNLGLRLPSYSEANALAKKYDVPGVGQTELFWTDEEFFYSNGVWYAEVVAEDGGRPLPQNELQSYQTVCVTDPSA